MKILLFSGGLGNQIFEYAFYCWLKEQFPNETFYGVYNRRKLSEHYGLEIDKWFHVTLPKTNWKATLLTYLMYFYKQLFPQTKYLDLNQRQCMNVNAWIYYAFKLSNKYIPQEEWITWNITENELTNKNKCLLNDIRKCNSVFIHVRRGDYLSPVYRNRFEGTCPLEYYQKSIKEIQCKVENPTFFCFSDDIDWVRDNLDLDRVYYVDWNKGKQSPLDMFLMSQCKYAIIANSTFSYWGAMLGVNKKLVYYPSKWINSKLGNPQIFPSHWNTF